MGSEAYRITNTGYVVWHSRLSAAHPLPLWIVTSSTRFRLQLFCKDTCMNFAVPPSVRELPPIIITYSTAVYIDRSQSWRENTSVWIQRAAGAEASRTMVLNLCFGRQSCERKGRGAELWTVRLQHSVMLRLLLASVFHSTTVAVFPESNPNYHCKSLCCCGHVSTGVSSCHLHIAQFAHCLLSQRRSCNNSLE